MCNDAPAAEEEDGEAPADGKAKEIASAVGDWFSSRQEPVAFTAIADANPCMLDGNYGWFKSVGVSQVWISHTVSGCEIPDGAMVLTWA